MDDKNVKEKLAKHHAAKRVADENLKKTAMYARLLALAAAEQVRLATARR